MSIREKNDGNPKLLEIKQKHYECKLIWEEEKNTNLSNENHNQCVYRNKLHLNNTFFF